MFNRRSVTAVLLAGALASGCSEGPTEPPTTGEPLSAAESVALFEAMRAIHNDTAATIIGGSENSMVLACPLGGQVTLTMSVVEESVADTATLTANSTASPSGCQLSSGGTRFTVDGRPSVRERIVTTFVGFFEAFTLEGSVTGALDWQTDRRSGSCDIDLTLSEAPDSSGTGSSVAVILAGTLCGHETRLEREGVVDPDPSG
ncbi:hypothetical protein [Candidatus Palauibacter polyketidifaciens]|uniref:hypothetical protein n=1 Tax=Candidatus Palauibacter polyketidifaciens TaxID=3056740 RepID=UPI00139EF37F|nr:hypothetical protein [Candidatus Palauibacter polyketidifaciens]MDE2720573.1 hypothetical protein [Candidatus Palauibacter polyketidifaciens]MYE33631.1 hypothetical protein [Gemmatimonadales bacterium]